MASKDGFFKGFVLGSLIGGFAALLLAPKTGKEFREDLEEESEKIFKKARKDFETAQKAAAHSYEIGRDKFMEKMVETNDENDLPNKEKTSETSEKPEVIKKN